MNSNREASADPSSGRFVKVAPPSVHAGIGEALRRAYRSDPEARSLQKFEDLLAQLK